VAFNNVITASPVLLFLGAGASAAAGKPTMAKFVENLQTSLRMDCGGQLLHLLTVARGPDLENILSDLEMFLNLPYLAAFQCKPEFATAEAGTGRAVPITIAEAEAALLRSALRHEIIREYRSIDRDAIVAAYEPLLELVFGYVDPTVHCLPIFTTNYDLAIETLCETLGSKYDLEDGLELDPISKTAFWNRNEFDLYRIWHGRRNIVEFKLHGSVDWIRSAKSGRIVRAPAMYDALDSDEYQNAIIYPAGNKVANRDPYFSGYEYFARCCEQAVVLIVIGYSFRDYDALNRLMGARGRNERLKIVLLSPDAYGIISNVIDEDLRYSIRPVSAWFGKLSQQTEYLQRIEESLRCLRAPVADAG
jgi:hypothetical protein